MRGLQASGILVVTNRQFQLSLANVYLRMFASVAFLAAAGYAVSQSPSGNLESRSGSVEVSLPPGLDTATGWIVANPDLRVGSVEIQKIAFKHTDVGSTGLVRYDMRITYYCRKGRDKSTTTVFDLRNGEEIITLPLKLKRKVDETDHARSDVALIVAKQKMTSHTRLGIVLTTQDD